jgi:thioredoxin reductase
LLRIDRKELTEYGGRVHSAAVLRARRTGAEFVLTCADGTELRGRRLVLASGLVDEHPDISGLAPRWARDVVHCPYCHGWELCDRPTAVLVSTVEDVMKAMVVSRLSPDTMLFLHDTEESAIPNDPRRRLARAGIQVVAGRVEELLVDNDRLLGLRMEGGSVVRREVLYVSRRFVARNELSA